MDNYILLYGDKKPEDNIIIKNMFSENKQINLGWTEFDYNKNMNMIEDLIKQGTTQIIFSGFEIGWDKLVKEIKRKYPDIKIKVICNTQDSLLYYEYERNNFFNMLNLAKEKLIDIIAFLRKGQYETYKNIGYNCFFLRENYNLEQKDKISVKQENGVIDLGVYPLNYTWDKNIFNQLCIAKFIKNCNLNYNNLDERMEDFLSVMEINNFKDRLESIDEKELIRKISKNDCVVATSFTEYVHPVFFISMELGVPCLIGNNSDFFEGNEELKEYVVTSAEDNCIINSQKVEKMLKNKMKIRQLYKIWKEKYNDIAKNSIIEFLEK